MTAQKKGREANMNYKKGKEQLGKGQKHER